PTSYAGSVTDNTYSNSNYFGVYGRFVIATTSRRVYFDNIRLGDLVLTGSEGWRMLSSPVSTSFSSLLNGLFTQGISGATSTSGNPSVFVYDGSNWSAPSNMSNTIAAGQGFIAKVFEDNDPDTEGIQGGFPKQVRISGTEFP